jgi:hypothetical protein
VISDRLEVFVGVADAGDNMRVVDMAPHAARPGGGSLARRCARQ